MAAPIWDGLSQKGGFPGTMNHTEGSGAWCSRALSLLYRNKHIHDRQLPGQILGRRADGPPLLYCYQKVTIPQYCAYFTPRRFGIRIISTAGKSRIRRNNRASGLPADDVVDSSAGRPLRTMRPGPRCLRRYRRCVAVPGAPAAAARCMSHEKSGLGPKPKTRRTK